MAANQTIELARVAPSPGDGKRLNVEVEPGSVELAGHTYELTPELLEARLEVSRAASGYALHLSFDGTVTVWDLHPGRWLAAACGLAGRELTDAEWDQFIGEGSPHPICSG